VRNFKQYMELENTLKPVTHNGNSHKTATHKSVAHK
jgi:hypothetical protein